MAVDIHIKIDTIPGQSEHKGFEGQIQVENFSLAMNQVTNFGSALAVAQARSTWVT